MAPRPATLPRETLSEVELDVRQDERTAWCRLSPPGRPCFTETLLADLCLVQEHLTGLASPSIDGIEPQIGWVALASREPNVFSLGGDLALFAKLARDRNVIALRQYAYACVNVSHANWRGYGDAAITIGLAQGDALGGGFESLLSCDVLVAERRAKFGLPEIVFGLFPGMGAHVFLIRKVGPAKAHEIIVSGKQYNAETMHALGIVDVLAEDGAGEAAVRSYVSDRSRLHATHLACHRARRVVAPVTLNEMYAVADIWVETAARMSEQNLRRMEHVAAAQERSRRLRRAASGVSERLHSGSERAPGLAAEAVARPR